ncbi:PREDICTED: ultraviolet-B receptor UVR8 isoform X2 [Tarenaya hassleriana]|uniref:ultraviolet-B receptor UVR8 isoform X2 n=1 Tax=Tarenaya hassleriana TaxID=28532 RepID=UPI00053C1C19|nr:PREDICTED: ultraviolet-B receptor UVR8 isoform X2 [Tarenaya hassleriana]
MLTRGFRRFRIPRLNPGQNNPISSVRHWNPNSGSMGFGWRRWLSSESGKRFAAMWGSGDFGRLGLRNLESRWRPAVCSALSEHSISALACGGAHTLFLTETGRVFATGLNDCGQLGVSGVKAYTMEPLEVLGLKDVLYVSAGYSHSAAITVDGELYMWGKNSSGQLGLGKKAAKVVHSPVKVESLNGITIKSVALGSEHSVAVTDGGEILSWGGGGSGRLGHGHESTLLGILRSSSEFTPRLIKKLEGVKVENVAAGLLHSACTDENGSAFIFGERAINKLGFGGANNATTPSIISEVPYAVEISCGGYHTCVVTRGGELYTWGSNENGCLGTESRDASHSPVRVEGPFLKSSVSKVVMSSPGDGEVPMALSPSRDILLGDSWVMVMM